MNPQHPILVTQCGNLGVCGERTLQLPLSAQANAAVQQKWNSPDPPARVNWPPDQLARQSNRIGGQVRNFGSVQWGWPRVVQYLIVHGAKVDIKDDSGVSPLDVASGRGGPDDNHPSDEVAKILQTATRQ